MDATTAGHERWMALALEQAHMAEQLGEVPVGCVIVHDDQVIGRGHNRRELDQDPSAHAEMLALRQAAHTLGSWRLLDTSVYVTLEPCPMCAGALVNSRVQRVIYGCDDLKAGALRSLYALGNDTRLNHRFDVVAGICADACATQLSNFFRRLRGQDQRP